MALAEGQYSIRGLTLGPGTLFEILNNTNPFDRTVRADTGDSRAWNHGSWSGAEWQAEAVVRLNVCLNQEDLGDRVASTAGWLELRHQIAQAFRPIGDQIEEVELRFALGGSEWLLRGRPRGVEHDVNLIRAGRSVTQCGFAALDPFIYSGADVVTGPITLPTFTGGLTVPFTVPFTVDATLVGGQAALTNEGTADTPLLLRIDGPALRPFVAVAYADGRVDTLRFNLELQSGQWLDVDTGARTVLLNGQASRRGQTAGEFPILPSDTHEIHFRADEDAGGTLTARHRHAWW